MRSHWVKWTSRKWKKLNNLQRIWQILPVTGNTQIWFFNIKSNKMQQSILFILRILLGLFFLALGILHFYYNLQMAIFVPLPTGATTFVYAIGSITAALGILIIFNKYVRQSLIALSVLLFLTAGMVQIGIEWRNPDPILSQVGISNVVKLLIACIILLVLAVRRR